MPKLRVSTLVLTIALVVSVLAALNFFVGRNAERAKRVWAEDQLQRITRAKDALEKERDELASAKQALEDQLNESGNRAKAIADELAQEKRAREALTSELADVREESDESRGQLDRERKEKLVLTEELAKAKQSYQALSNELTTLRQAKEALEKRVKEMLAARAKEAEKIVVTPPAGAAASPSTPRAFNPSPISPSVSAAPSASGSLGGKVLVVNREFNFVVANLGSKDGIRAGSRYEILRSGQRVATAEVEKVYDNMSAANLLGETKKQDVKEGDEVRLIS
ncbi:MAG: hypothetical protein HYZ94_00340 [Candidatus Omnitrophica bacterium]|nr:hypothetical protein [Candidatus Omnitrophota bacterium]